MQSKQKPL